MGRIFAWRIRKAASARRPPRSTWPSAWPRPASARCLIDLDPQCNATSGLGQQPADRHPLVSDLPLRESIVTTTTEGLELLPGSRSFQDIEALVASAESNSATLAPASGRRDERV